MGEIVELVATIGRVGRTSMTVGIHLFGEATPGSNPRLATRGEFVMVAIDGEGHATPIRRRAGG